MKTIECSPLTPWGLHTAVRNDENCPRCGWTAPGPRTDARCVSVIDGDAPPPA
ncbi:MAG TPA: hypothetical protein VF577_08070 [Allosphingosinicella sp.]|jgi:hypothetical protein